MGPHIPFPTKPNIYYQVYLCIWKNGTHTLNLSFKKKKRNREEPCGLTWF